MMQHKFKKHFGQNFLQDENIIQKIVSIEDLTFEDLVIEIGPGAGALTKKLIEKTNVLAYEIDTELKDCLSKLQDSGHFSIIWADFLKRNILNDLSDYKYKNLYIISNLPYYITTPIIEKIINEKIDVRAMILMVQKEVGERFIASPGTKNYGSITVFLNYYFDITKSFDVSKNCFYPKPNVDSCILKFKRRTNQFNVIDEDKFFKLIRDSFRYKRKTLKNNLSTYDLVKIEEILKKNNLDLSVRAENISLLIFVEIANNL